MKYFQMKDSLQQTEVIMQNDDGTFSQFCFGEEVWMPCGTPCASAELTGISAADAEAALNAQRSEYEKLLALALQVAEEGHRGQVDKGGQPYINHPKAVAASLTNTEYKIAGYLHDICEDTPATFDDLLRLGFTPRIVQAVRLLTKVKGQSYREYLSRIREDACARAVKIADLKHNMDISRIPAPAAKDFARVEKYKKSLAFLEGDDDAAKDFR